MFSDKFGREPEGMNPHWAAKTALEAAGVPVLDLTRSNPTLAGIPYPQGPFGFAGSARYVAVPSRPQRACRKRAAPWRDTTPPGAAWWIRNI